MEGEDKDYRSTIQCQHDPIHTKSCDHIYATRELRWIQDLKTPRKFGHPSSDTTLFPIFYVAHVAGSASKGDDLEEFNEELEEEDLYPEGDGGGIDEDMIALGYLELQTSRILASPSRKAYDTSQVHTMFVPPSQAVT